MIGGARHCGRCPRRPSQQCPYSRLAVAESVRSRSPTPAGLEPAHGGCMTFIGSTRPEIDRGPVPRIARVGSRGLAKPARHGRMLPLARLVACVTVLASRLAGAQCGSSAVPIERVQEASATTSAGATSLSLAWPAPTAAGNFLVLAVHVLW